MDNENNYRLELPKEITILKCKFRKRANFIYIYLCCIINNEQIFMMLNSNDKKTNEILNYIKIFDIIDIFPFADPDYCYIVTKLGVFLASYNKFENILNLPEQNIYLQIEKELKHDQYLGALTEEMYIEIYDLKAKKLHLAYTPELRDDRYLLEFKMIDNDCFKNCFAYSTMNSLTVYDYLEKKHVARIRASFPLMEISCAETYILGLGNNNNVVYFYDFM
jgi:hypothetical protein